MILCPLPSPELQAQIPVHERWLQSRGRASRRLVLRQADLHEPDLGGRGPIW